MRVIAKAGGYEVVQELNGVIAIYRAKLTVSRAEYICDSGSAYETIVAGVKDPVIRKELLRQAMGVQK